MTEPAPRSGGLPARLLTASLAMAWIALPPAPGFAGGSAQALLEASVPAPELRAGDPSPAILSALAAEGWKPAEPPRAFSPETLYEEIDGEAELFLPYDFRSLSVAILASDSRPGVELRVESYRHGSPRDAFGIFSQYRHPEQETALVGPSEAAVSDGSLDFFRGDTFVRMRVASGSLDREALVAAGEAVVGAMTGPADPPPGAAIVSIPSTVRGTVLYQRRAMLGYESLAPGYEARFSAGGLSGRTIWIDGAEAGADHRERLARSLPGFRKEPAGGGPDGSGAAAAEGWTASLLQGTLRLRAVSGGTVGVLGKLTPGEAAAILDALSRNAAAARSPAR